MKLYSMTATFGKLEHETLTLKPGLNIISAPNEWGKSTWCAFLCAMLYGLDTRAKTTKTALADKERYAPWSGSPMSGRIDLNWNGRDITIERSSKGRIPLGTFRAYETATGLDIPELTAANCGQALLGVEQSVFRRASFIRFSDLPVTDDDALRARLNALVTTGDDSGDAAKLEKGLKELRNRIRYNKTGLLPEAEALRNQLQDKLDQYAALDSQANQLTANCRTLTTNLEALQNHRDALLYAEAQAHAKAVEEARAAREAARNALDDLEEKCALLPSREEANEKAAALEALRIRGEKMEDALHSLPPMPKAPDYPAFRDMDGADAIAMAQQDTNQYRRVAGISWLIFTLLGVFTAAGAAYLFYQHSVLFIPLLIVSLGALFLGLYRVTSRRSLRKTFRERYGCLAPKQWQADAQAYADESFAYAKADNDYRIAKTALDLQMNGLRRDRADLCGESTVEEALTYWRQAVLLREAHANALREAQSTEKQYAALKAMAKKADPPKHKDSLTFHMADTNRRIQETADQLRRQQNRLSEYRGKLDTLGDPAVLERKRDHQTARIQKLEETYQAAVLGLSALNDAAAELQRRFAPKITRQAQTYLSAMTSGRYDRMSLSRDFTLWAGTPQEDTTREALFRSDGTLDQLYLSLRLAVSEALCPDSPLILDDALVRFDDTRLRAALTLLRQLSQSRQILLFTCQERETRM